MPSLRSVSRRSPRRTRSTISRVRPSGLSYGTPWKPSITCGPLAPRPEDRPALADVVEPGRGLEDRARRARVDVEDRRPDLHRLGLGGEVPHQRGRVEPVGLRHPDRVQPRLLQGRDLVGGLAGVAGVHQLGRRASRLDCDRATVTVASAGRTDLGSGGTRSVVVGAGECMSQRHAGPDESPTRSASGGRARRPPRRRAGRPARPRGGSASSGGRPTRSSRPARPAGRRRRAAATPAAGRPA